jgi:hypothetical protein
MTQTTTTSSMPAASTKVYRFCSISYAGIVCKDTIISSNSEDDFEETEDEDEAEEVEETESLSVKVPPYVKENIERYSVIIKGLIEKFPKW